MPIDSNALFLPVDGVYGADALGLLARDLVRVGVVGPGDLQVTAGAGMSVNVAAGAAWVAGTISTAQPTYRVAATGVTNLAVGAAHATLNRYDIVVVEVLDATFSGMASEARFRVVEGTPAASPDVPDVPASAAELAVVYVQAAATAVTSIGDNRQPGGGAWHPGQMSLEAGADAPHGALVADGSLVSRRRYPRLFARIGGTYGAFSVFQFTLPDWRGRVGVAAGAGAGLTPRALGALFGGEDLPAHAHSTPDHQHVTPNHQHVTPDHQHFVSLATSANGAHGHTSTVTVVTGDVPAGEGVSSAIQSTGFEGGWVTSEDGDHAHTVSGNTAAGGSGLTPVGGGGTTVAGGGGMTGIAGAGAHGVMQPSIGFTPVIWT